MDLVTSASRPAVALNGRRLALALDRRATANHCTDHQALSQARERLLQGERLSEIREQDVQDALGRIAAIQARSDLPVAPELMRLVVDTLAFRHRLSSRARA